MSGSPRVLTACARRQQDHAIAQALHVVEKVRREDQAAAGESVLSSRADLFGLQRVEPGGRFRSGSDVRLVIIACASSRRCSMPWESLPASLERTLSSCRVAARVRSLRACRRRPRS